MNIRVVPVWVIQDRFTGKFLAESLDWVRSLRNAGRLHSVQEAHDTLVDQSSPEDADIHMFFEMER